MRVAKGSCEEETPSFLRLAVIVRRTDQLKKNPEAKQTACIELDQDIKPRVEIKVIRPRTDPEELSVEI